ncbi:MAG: phospholipase D-like domain-containing protein [Pseudomonadota bacterium]
MRTFLALAAALLLSGAIAGADMPAPPAATARVEAYFTPGDAIDQQIIALLRRAQREILVQAYVFTHRGIAKALIEAHGRGVAVTVIADRAQAERFSGWLLRDLADAGVAVLLDGEHEAAHSKVIVVDSGLPGAAVVTGSYNFTYGAQHRNAENLVILSGNAGLMRKFAEDWRRHRSHSSPLPP